MLHPDVKTYLEKLDQEQKPLMSYNGEYDIAAEIEKILTKIPNYKLTFEDGAELAAFDFMADPLSNNHDWGTYYSPKFVFWDQQGQGKEYPSIQKVKKETLIYWTERTKVTQNPILSSRYADLVVDFSKKITEKNPPVELFQIVINSNIEICKKSLVNPKNRMIKIKRALILAIQINNQENITQVKEAIIDAAQKSVGDDRLKWWSFAFQSLILDYGKKIQLNEAEKTKLIKELEDRLKAKIKYPRLTDNTVDMLAKYYAKIEDKDNLIKVLSIYERFWKETLGTNSDAFWQMHVYTKIHEIYRHYADRGFEKAEEASGRISQEISNLDLDWDKSLEKVSISIEIKQKFIDHLFKEFFGDKEQHKLEIILSKIVNRFLPRKEKIKKQLKDFSGKNLMQSLIRQQIISEDGMLIAKLTPSGKDDDSYFQHSASQDIQFGSCFLMLTMSEFKKRISKQNITEYFRNSYLFENENNKYLEQAISAYWDEDSSHLFMLMIERSIRKLIKNCGGTVIKPNALNGYEFLSLNQLLDKQSDVIEKMFGEVDHNIPFYFRLILTEKLGMNLRNDFAHGINIEKFSTPQVSDRLFHIMLCLSLVRKKSKNK